MKRIYISGPISGIDRAVYLANFAVESKGDPPIRRIVKGAGHNNKIDPVHALLDALYCFDLAEGKVTE